MFLGNDENMGLCLHIFYNLPTLESNWLPGLELIWESERDCFGIANKCHCQMIGWMYCDLN